MHCVIIIVDSSVIYNMSDVVIEGCYPPYFDAIACTRQVVCYDRDSGNAIDDIENSKREKEGDDNCDSD